MPPYVSYLASRVSCLKALALRLLTFPRLGACRPLSLGPEHSHAEQEQDEAEEQREQQVGDPGARREQVALPGRVRAHRNRGVEGIAPARDLRLGLLERDKRVGVEKRARDIGERRRVQPGRRQLSVIARRPAFLSPARS